MTTQSRDDRQIKTRSEVPAMPSSNGEPACNETTVETKRIAAAFAAPFAPTEVLWKPQAVSGNRALAVPYVDARAIMDRLDAVVGIDGWQDQYELLPDGSVVCKLRVHIGEWVEKTDIGGQSEQKDEHDKHKAAFSDALKRAAVKFAIGRYLYRVRKQWCDYDPKKKAFVTVPTLPPEALPGAMREAKSPDRQAVLPTGKPATPSQSANASADKVGKATAYMLKELTERLGWQAGQLRSHLRGKFGVEYVRDLSSKQATAFRHELDRLIGQHLDTKA